MNIVYIGSAFEIFNIKLASSFSKHYYNYNVFFITVDEELTEQNKQTLEINNIKFLGSLSSFSIKNFFGTYKSIKRINRLIRKHKIEIAHISFATPYALWIPFIKCKKLITTRGSDVLIVLPNLLKTPSLLNNIQLKIFKKAFRKANYVTSTSTKQIESINNLFGSLKIELIRTGIPVDEIINNKFPLPRELENKKYIFSPRYIGKTYNTLIQVEAISQLSKSILSEFTFVFLKPNTHFIDSEYVALVQSKLDSIEGLNYCFLEEVDQPTIFALYKNASLTFMNPISDGTPSSALEAMAAKCPLIMGNLDYDSDLFDNVCLRLKDNSSENLAHNIELAINDYPKHLIEKAFETVYKKGNIKFEMEKMNQLYKSLING